MLSTAATDDHVAPPGGGDGDSIATKTPSPAQGRSQLEQTHVPAHVACANEALQQPCKNSRGWRKIVRNFTPSYVLHRHHDHQQW